MIDLITNLSVQRREFSLNQQVVNIRQVVSQTFDELRVGQTICVKLIKRFPPDDSPSIICGDPELLKKVFRKRLLNAIESLPNCDGSVEVRSAGRLTAKSLHRSRTLAVEFLPNSYRTFFGRFKRQRSEAWESVSVTRDLLQRYTEGRFGLRVRSMLEPEWISNCQCLSDTKKGAEFCESKNPAG